MNRKMLTYIGIAILVVVLIGYFAVKGRSSRVAPGVTSEGSMTEENSTKMSTLRDLMGLGTSQTCTFTDPQSKSTGTIYVGGGKARADVDIVLESQPEYISHMVNDSEAVYVWQEGQTTGFKTTLADIGEISENSEVPAEDKTVNVDNQIEYECHGWSVDQSKFELPSDVEFTDMSTMMKDAMKQAGDVMESQNEDVKAQQCSVCDSLSGDAQTSCKQALGC